MIMRRRLLEGRVAAALLLFTAACGLIVETEVGAGLGTRCFDDDQCQGSRCIDSVCAIACGDVSGCPFGTTCASGSCQLPLETVFLYPFDPAQDDTARSLEDARSVLDEELPYVESEADVGYELASDAVARATELEAAGVHALVATSELYASAFTGWASQHPSTLVLVHQGSATAANLVPFTARTYQAYFLAGVAAGRFSETGRVCMIGSVPSPYVLASINAFALGVQREIVEPAPVIELRWLGETHDTQPKVNGETRERRYTREMVEAGCEVVAHTLDNNIVLRTVADLIEDGADIYAVGANVEDTCEVLPSGRCLGATFFHWAPLLAPVLDDFHRQRLEPGVRLGRMLIDENDSVVDFAVGSGLSGGVGLASDLDALRAAIAADAGVGPVFDGPIASASCEATTGNVPCVAADARLDDAGLATMCWLVDGVVDEAGEPAVIPANASCAAAEE